MSIHSDKNEHLKHYVGISLQKVDVNTTTQKLTGNYNSFYFQSHGIMETGCVNLN